MKKCLFMLAAMVLLVGLAQAKPPLEKPLVPYVTDSRATESEPNNDCTTANPLTVGDDMNAAIDAAGDQDWFAFEAQAGDCVIFETHPGTAGDTKMWIFDGDCVTQLAYNDDGGEGFYSLIQYDFTAAGTYYVKITHYSSSGTGTYILTATACPEPQPNDTCDGAIDLQLQGLQSFEVDLCLFANDYNPAVPGPSCTGYSANGMDATFKIFLAAGEHFFATEDGTIDMAMYLVTDCSDLTTCVAGSDNCCGGAQEVIDYTADADGWFFLIVDAYSGCGMVTVAIDNPVAAQDRTWGSVKDLYR